MKKILAILLIATTNFASAQNLEKIRDIYFTEDINLSKYESLNTIIDLAELKNNTINAYLGANYLLYCNISKDVFEKFSYFEKGKEIIEQAIKLEPDNIEIKFLRYINQINPPWFLNYKQNIKDDYQFITSNLHNIKNQKLKNKILQTIINYN